MSVRRFITLPRSFLALLILFIVLQWGLHATGLAILTFFPLLGVGAVFSFRLIRKSIWRLRNRLYVTYVFVGVVPIALILLLTGFGTYIVTGQVAAYLVSAELERRAAALVSPVRVLSQAKPADRPAVAAQIERVLGQRMPHLEIVVTGDQPFHYPAGSNLENPEPDWQDYTGNLTKGRVYYSAAIVKTGSVIAAALAPIDDDVLKNLVPGIGALRFGSNGKISGSVPPPEPGWERLDFTTVWGNDLHYEDWKNPQSGHTGIFFVTTRPSAVLKTVFSNGIDTAQVVTFAFVAVFVTLVIVQLASWLIGISLTRTVTGAVHGLYEGTQRIAEGDFSWRIPVKGKDQLAELGKSFNNMTAQLENLVVIAKEKERLQSEVQIAGEVQNQLFPRATPEMRTIELVGVCEAARMVSGDYYDYLCLPDGNLALAIGDVAGKGISAALLMASIQSIMRTQLAAGLARSATAGNGNSASHLSTSNMVAQLNRQLYANTAPEKYATFFFGVYEENSRVLTYTNAGHLQPLLLHNGNSQLLEVTGTVVGAFPVIRYEEQTVQIQSGDMLIAYTDGITEPENAYGQEFGIERLSETALRYQHSEPQEVVARIMEAVKQWSTAPELPDDMTIVIARGRG
jgi:sigma-B regulation protein RsbU (phosphoserine phosphatase)